MGAWKGRRKRKRKSRELGQTTKPAPGLEIGEDISHLPVCFSFGLPLKPPRSAEDEHGIDKRSLPDVTHRGVPQVWKIPQLSHSKASSWWSTEPWSSAFTPSWWTWEDATPVFNGLPLREILALHNHHIPTCTWHFLLPPGANWRFQSSKPATKGSRTRVCFVHSGSIYSTEGGPAMSWRENQNSVASWSFQLHS